MPQRFLPQIQTIIHDADMERVLMAVFHVVDANKYKSGQVAKVLTETLARYENEDCWKDIIVYSPIAGQVCDVLENGSV